ncbi:SusC/RagA family TonB-linked outer membrane protein [Flavobacterium sp. F-380]|uniref:SusC/RagA family TonB-linked outer membrane protein n=1 Tax=Flavobacterium kayseriense TaxID=2764714 RepID=A0ABR7J8C4_9FLAO|nr:SusC/RagA family TonB-linked outer membrane protein [Flavobacterium kayseriense]MBC5841643.1 SusC/RagA family TonB-linked outer membrane protein [Flavobacterium kayseriense]MBC5848171.1 SusC/RagA family TonB-linked outer membrane protein [Flavobacterium kayseriense]
MRQLYLAFLLTLSCLGYAQTTITGTVTAKDNGTPIPYVTINTDGKNGTKTDADGVYTVEVNATSTKLKFSYVGYKTQTIIVGSQRIINVQLESDSENLNEVVVTALGLKREAKELGYAVQTLKAKDLTEVKTVNFLDNLAGKVAGVTITQGATGVGSSSKVTIRGESSFSNNNPLFVVDGIPINNETVFNFTNEAAAGFQEIDYGNGAMEVNPDDIESVTVLKGPSAAALYGTRASNGVIVIKTKDGNKNKGFTVSFNTSLTVDTAFKLPEFQNEYGQGNSGAFAFVNGLGGGTNDNISYSWGPRLNQGTLIPQFDSPVALPNGTFVRGGDTSLYNGLPITPTPFISHPNNLKDFYQTGKTTINNLSISNGFEKGDYRLSFTDLRSESIIPGVNLDRQTVAAKLNFEPSDKTTISTSINYVHSSSDNRPSNGYGSENVNYSLVGWGPRSLDINSLKNYWQPGLEGIQHFSFNYTFFDNPYFTLLENRNSFERDRIFGNIQLKQEIAKNLTFTVRSGMDYSTETRQMRRNFSSNRFKNGGYAEHDVKYREVNTDFLLNYTAAISDFTFDASFGGNRMDRLASTKQAQTVNLAQPGIFNLNNAASPIEVFQFESKKRINSLYGVAKIGFKDYLFLDITARNDWSSALATPFSVSGTSFFYPSVSTGFILSNIVNLPSSITFAKLRASVAQVGNDTSPYQTSGAFVAQIPFNGQPTFSNQNFIPNANLRPEQTTSYELGTDIRLFKDRLNFDFTYYNSNTTDQIISLPIAISSGYNQQVVNGGKVNTQGIEVILGVIPIKTENFKWNTTFNFARSRSVVKNLPQEGGRLTLAYSRIYDSANQTVWFQVEEGGRIGDMYGTGYLKNDKGDFVLTNAGNYIADNNLRKIGNYNPDFTLGWSNNFTYKNWNLSFLLDWRQGGEIVSRTRALGNVGGQLAETAYRPAGGIVAQGVINTGSTTNPVYTPNTTAISAESYYRQYYDRNHEENNVYDASFLKMRQFSIGYAFKVKEGFFGLTKSPSFNASIIGNNLFAITQNPHFDPEQLAVQGTGFVSGVEDMSYATSRSIGLKLGVTF